MKTLKLRVIFDCRERIYCDDECIGHKPVFEEQKYLDNWQEVLDFIHSKYLNDIDCEVFDIRPEEIDVCIDVDEESEQETEEETDAVSCSDVADATSQDKLDIF